MTYIHHFSAYPQNKLAWLLEELQSEYLLFQYDKKPNRLVPLNPIHTKALDLAITIEDGDIKLTNSGAAIEYILQTYGEGRLVPTIGSLPWIQHIFWMHFAESFYSGFPHQGFFDNLDLDKPAVKQTNASLLSEYLDFIEKTLQESPWFGGDSFTVADIQMTDLIICGGFHKEKFGNRPFLIAYIDRIEQRPA